MTTVFVTVGTDHHPFTRLIGWLEAWSESRGRPATWLVQHGASPQMAGARNVVSLPFAELQAAHREADVVVGQVGPGTIADANAAGKRPLVVPRHPALREVVDNHQAIYGQLMFKHLRVHLAEEQEKFDLTLDRLVADPQQALLGLDASDQTTLAVLRVRGLLTDAVDSSRASRGVSEVTRRVLELGRARVARRSR